MTLIHLYTIHHTPHIYTIELKKRNYPKISLNPSVNRTTLLHLIHTSESQYFQILNYMYSMIEKIKSMRRIKKDLLRKEYDDIRDRIQHESDRFIGKFTM